MLKIVFGLVRVRTLGFRQCKTIIMTLIPISCSSVSCCRRCLRSAKWLSDVPSAPRFLVDVFSFVVHAEFEVGVLHPEDIHFANYRFSFRKLQILISQTTDFHFVLLHFVSQILQ